MFYLNQKKSKRDKNFKDKIGDLKSVAILIGTERYLDFTRQNRAKSKSNNFRTRGRGLCSSGLCLFFDHHQLTAIVSKYEKTKALPYSMSSPEDESAAPIRFVIVPSLRLLFGAICLFFVFRQKALEPTATKTLSCGRQTLSKSRASISSSSS